MHFQRAALALLVAAAALSAAKAAPKPKKAPLTPEERAAQSILKSMSLRDRVAQMIIGTCYGDAPGMKTPEYQKYRHWVKDLRIGGLIVANRIDHGAIRNAEPHAMALFLNQMQKLAKTPLLVAADLERGASMRVSGGAQFPYNMAYGAGRDLNAVKYEGLATARQARAIGIQWIFAPVADVNNNPENPVINTRSFGENAEDVAQNVAAYIDGAHSDPKNRVLVTAKHFPGHGDTATDSHLALPRVTADKDRLEALEFAPFRAAIEHGVDSIMTAHLAVPALEPEEIPATVSSKVLTGVLRDEMKFQHLIVTDAMDMQGLTKLFPQGEASVRAIEAGADVLLMPLNPETVIHAVVSAVEEGRIKRARIDESALRILAAKVRVGINKKKLVDLDEISDVFESEEDVAQAQLASDRAITLVRNEHDLLPLQTVSPSCLVVVTERRTSTSGQRMADSFHKFSPKSPVFFVDASMNAAALEATVGDPQKCSAIVVAAFSTVAANRGTVSLSGELTPFIAKLTEASVPVAIIAMGNPYLLTAFPKTAAYLASFSSTPPSEASAVKALFGEIPILGKMPVTIPGFAKIGDGIPLPVRAR
ncbi:MAG TPA: glycoside hydrolase family 3 N-terminal domain-containing protein [Bryobacteraceae bacterium]|nr:glycoside hydrolase family 3 N-terminal domain-containing protein [Bryobacteraceae bacterium]